MTDPKFQSKNEEGQKSELQLKPELVLHGRDGSRADEDDGRPPCPCPLGAAHSMEKKGTHNSLSLVGQVQAFE